MATFFSAKYAKVRVGAVVVTAKKWTAKMTAGEIDVTNFEGSGYSDVITGILSLVITIELDIDGALNPWDTAPSPNLTPGTTLSTVKCYMNDTALGFWSLPSCKVIDCDNPMDVKAGASATFTIKNKGTFAVPTGALAT